MTFLKPFSKTSTKFANPLLFRNLVNPLFRDQAFNQCQRQGTVIRQTN